MHARTQRQDLDVEIQHRVAVKTVHDDAAGLEPSDCGWCAALLRAPELDNRLGLTCNPELALGRRALTCECACAYAAHTRRGCEGRQAHSTGKRENSAVLPP